MSDSATAVRVAVAAAVGAVTDPELHRPLAELDMLGEVSVDGERASFELRLTIAGCPAADRIERDVRAAALGVSGIREVELTVRAMTPAERESLVTRLRPSRGNPFGPGTLTRVVAVTSGKGGVGKSTVTANLAVALAARGLKLGLIDADVFGFSIPGLLGLSGAAPTRVGELILPPEAHGVRVISIGMFLPAGQSQAVSWRGPLLHRTMEQFLADVYFGDLDVLLLDLPPGTGDVAISLGQLLPNAEVLVVTTPQAAAAEVAERSGLLAVQTGQRVIGVVENLSGELFGSGGGETLATRLGVPLLASVPASAAVRQGGDAGAPVVLTHPDDPAARELLRLADALAAQPRGLAGRALPLSVG